MDKGAEELIVKALLAARPDDGIIGEEGTSRPSTSGITWVIDPLDGTVNYFYGLSGWNISIAAKDESGVLVGVVSAPTINMTWHATLGGGAFVNGAPISCNNPVAMENALIATGFSYSIAARTKQVEMVGYLIPRVRDIRRLGAAAVDLCNVAMGAVDAFYEVALNEWDVAAGLLIASEAGAKFSYEGSSTTQLTVVAGPDLYDALFPVLNSMR